MDFDDIEVGNADTTDHAHIDDILNIENEENEKAYTTLNDCVIFLLDCSSSMHTLHHTTSSTTVSNDNNKTTAISSVMAVAENFLKSKILSNQKDLFGLVCFNTSKTVNEMQFEGVNKLIDITAPDANLIKKIKIYKQTTNPNLCPNDYMNTLNEEFPSIAATTTTNSVSNSYLSNALWICHSMLKNYEKKNYNRRIFLFTDNDNPLHDQINERNIIYQRAKDMLDSDIIIELFPMNFNGGFDLHKFYDGILPYIERNDEERNADNILSFEQCEDRLRELTKRIRQKEFKKRTLGKCPFYLTSNTKIYLNLYSFIKKANKGRVFNIDARNNKILTTVNQITCKDTGSTLYPGQIGTYQLYGNQKVIFTKDEMAKIKSLDEPGIKLMGFKSINSIKPYYNVRESVFLYPNEQLSNGASQLCDALIKQLSNKNKCAIVKFVGRGSSNIKLCALIPQLESLDEDFFQTPPGFNMVFLPYADDIRSSEDILSKLPENVNDINDEQRNHARKLIKKMNISFDCRNFENVTLQKFYATLQALALEETEVEEVDDFINPDNNALETILKGCDKEFREVFGLDAPGDGVDADKKVSKKVKGRERSRSRSKDRVKVKKEKEDVDMGSGSDEDKGGNFSDDYIRKVVKSKGIYKYNVTQLKDICKMRGSGVKGKKKQELIEELISYLG